MKLSLSPFFFTFALLVAGCTHSVTNTVRCVQLDPLEKVFTEESYFVENFDTAAVAKGETATFQFVLRCAFPIHNLKIEAETLVNGKQQIDPSLKAFVGFTRAGAHTVKHSKDAIFPVSDYYPDCLHEIESIDVPPMQNQPVWVSYTIPRNAESGNYSATIAFTGTVNGKPFKIIKEVNTKVYPISLPEQTLWVTNWWSPHNFSKMNGNQPVELYSDRYWELLTAMANVMRDHGQNSYKIGGFHQDEFWTSLCNIQCTATQYSFDFTNFDKMVELLIREGGLKRIEGGHLAGRMPNTGVWYNQIFGVYIPKVGMRPFEDEMSQNFLSQFLPALYNHLESKGWTSMYVQYVADEPTDQNVMVMTYTDKPTNQNALSFIPIAEFVKKHMPGIPIIEAVMSTKVANTVNIWVPKLDHYRCERAFFLERQAAGDEVWFYTCNEPQGNYVNRYLELPLIQTRFMHWINYRYGITGYLHWGFNYWDSVNSALPAGDASIVYPAYGKVYSSIRLAAMRDGIADYELLKLLEQKAPEKAQNLVREVIKDVDNYDSNVYNFRQTRLRLLEYLSE
ncbi:MAG: DUF4091 domain-containing protein [Parabacteroides sp.]|nr:DUF4091 domain-containing protein [Parabacteroides sp.]